MYLTSDKLVHFNRRTCQGSVFIFWSIAGNSWQQPSNKKPIYKEDPESLLFCLCPCLPCNVGPVKKIVNSLKEYFSSVKEVKKNTNSGSVRFWGFLFVLVGCFLKTLEHRALKIEVNFLLAVGRNHWFDRIKRTADSEVKVIVLH